MIDFDIEGNIESVFGLADALAEATSDWRGNLRAGRDLARLPASGGPRYARRGPTACAKGGRPSLPCYA